jgi:hypothetical protein
MATRKIKTKLDESVDTKTFHCTSCGESYPVYMPENVGKTDKKLTDEVTAACTCHYSKTWGGKRPNSGRPSTGRKKHILYITDEEYLKVKQLIEQLRKPSE